MDPIEMQPSDVPSDVPFPGQVSPGGQFVSEEQRQALLDVIGKIRSKFDSYTAVQLAAGNKTDRMRGELLQQVFEKLQLAGVDLSDRESVLSFIEKLRQDTPELATMFEEAMNVLLGGAVVNETEMESGIQPVPGMDEINNNMQDETVPTSV